MNRDILCRILCVFLTLCMTLVLFAGIPLRAGAEDADAFSDLWEQIEALRDGVGKRGKKATVADYASISDEVYALVEQSGTAAPGSLQANGAFIKWRDNETGIPCCYSPAHEADKGTVSYIADKGGSIAELEHNEALLRAMAKRGGAPSSVNIGLIQPYYRDGSNYYDDKFVSYSPTYLQQANALAAKTRGQVIRYTLEDATLDTIAVTLESCGMVIFDSHGGTDYTNPDNKNDSTSRANCSYLWLSSGYETSAEFKQHWSEFLSSDEYSGSHTGPFGSYDNVYLSSDGSYCVSGQLIADHMKKNAPHSFLYMGICLGMATDGMQAPLRAKGVEAVYGYSQSVTFSGEVKYMTSITNSLIGGKTVSNAVAAAKSNYGNWDPAYSYYTLNQAKSNFVAFPIVVSSEDPYPGHGNVDDLQTVNSTWTLLPRYTVTAAVNDSSLGTVSVSATTITASPISGYYVQSAEITSGSGSCTVHGNTIDVDPQSACTVLVTFAPKPQVTLTLAGSGTKPITGTADSTVTLPATAEAKDGMEFVGWTADGLEQESTELPEYYAPGSSYTLPYANTTLYALYTYFDADAVVPITPRYVRVTPDDNFAAVVGSGNSFLIAVEVTSSAYVFNSSLSTPYANKNYQYISYLNGERGVLPSNSTTTACAVRIAPISGTSYYSMRLKNGSGSYVKSNRTVGITTTSSAYKLTVDTTTAEDCHYIRDSSYTSYRFMMNDHADGGYCFGFTNEAAYKTLLYRYEDKIIGQRYYLTAEPCHHTNAVLTDAQSPTCTSDGYTGDEVCETCGVTVTVGEVIPMLGHDRVTDAAVAATCTETGLTEGYHCSRCDDDTLAQEVTPKLGHELSWDGKVGDGTSHVLACSRCDYTENEACTMNNGICTICGYKVVDIASAALELDNDVDISYTVTVPADAENVYMVFETNGNSVKVNDDGTHTFLFEGVNPQCMGDNVSATLYATVDGVEYTDAQPTYSVLQYCRNKLADKSISAELRTLLSDMLAYGAAAQNYVSYKATALVSDDSELTNLTFSTFTPISGYVPVFAGADAPDVYWKAAGLTLRNNVAMNFTFYAEDITGLSIKVTLNGREETFTTFVPVEGKANTYKVTFYDITATEFYEDVTATFYRNNAQVGNGLTYSINTYICAKQNDSNPALAALVQALYNYGTSAKAYAE